MKRECALRLATEGRVVDSEISTCSSLRERLVEDCYRYSCEVSPDPPRCLTANAPPSAHFFHTDDASAGDPPFDRISTVDSCVLGVVSGLSALEGSAEAGSGGAPGVILRTTPSAPFSIRGNRCLFSWIQLKSVTEGA